MARKPVEQIPLSAQLRPVATTVDTYVRPAQSPLRGLAESLSTVDKSLQTYLQTQDKKAEQDAEIKGRAAFYNDHSGEFATAITEGKIPAQTSPFYVKGFKAAQGAAAGNKIRGDFQDWWDNWEGKDSDDPEAFSKGFQTFLSSKIGTQDPDVLRGVLPAVEALQANATTQYTQYRHDRTVEGNLTAHGAVISGTVQDGVDDGLVSDNGADYPAIFGNVDRVVAESLSKGDPGGKAVNTFIDVMSAKMLETKDPGLLKWFDQKVPGQDYTYGQTPHGLEVKNATVNSLETIANKQRADLDVQQRAEQKRLKDEAESKIIDGLFANPAAAVDDGLLTQAAKNGSPHIKVEVQQWRDAVLKGTPSDPAAVQGFYSRIIAGEVKPEAAMKDALSNEVFSNADDLRTAQAFVQSFKGQQDRIEQTRNSAPFRDTLEAIRARTIAKNQYAEPISGWSNEGFEASSDFRQLMTRWIIENPDAGPLEIEEQIGKVGKVVTDRIRLPEGGDAMSDPQVYDRDPRMPFSNSWTDSKQAVAQGMDADVREWEKANNVTPDQKAALEKQAERMGMDYPEFMRERHLKPRAKAPDGTPIDPTAYNPDDPDLGEGDVARPVTPEQAAQWIDAVFEQQAAAPLTERMDASAQGSSLLGLIRGAEADGNYNAVYGNPGNTRDLGQFTLDQILGFQQQARQRGLESTAVGGYQFLYKTLRGLKKEMGLAGSEMFTPQLQDRMGMALLERRGLSAYRAGRISKRQFAHSLSQEWAAVPSPNTGRSFYAGDGLNAATVRTRDVYAAMGFQPIAYAPADRSTDAFDSFNLQGGSKGPAGGNLTFNHPDQEAGIQPRLRSAVEEVGRELGVDFKVLSGYRSPNHKVERGKKSGGGEHTHGGAMDLDMSGMGDAQRYQLVQSLMAKGVKRFITYSGSPNMLHIDLKDQRGNGSPYFMHDKSAKNLKRAPAWLRALAAGDTV